MGLQTRYDQGHIDGRAIQRGKNRTLKAWLIASGAALGALLPVALELGALGPQLAHDVRQVCAALQVPRQFD
jgi:hypothetical protein